MTIVLSISVRLTAPCIAAIIAASCAPNIHPDIQKANQLAEKRRINANWSGDCNKDKVSNLTTCWVQTKGIWVRYLGQKGPYIKIGSHDFPGRKPSVRFDNDAKPFEIDDDPAVGISPQKTVVTRMLSASTAYTRYHVWPNGHKDAEVSLDGFPEAWERLQQLVISKNDN